MSIKNKFQVKTDPTNDATVIASVYEYMNNVQGRKIASAIFTVGVDGNTIDGVREIARSWGSARAKKTYQEEGRRERIDDLAYRVKFAASEFGTDGSWRSAIETPFWAS